MIAFISFVSRAVNHSIRGLTGTQYATRPVAMRRLGLAQLIRTLPGGILLPTCPILSPSYSSISTHCRSSFLVCCRSIPGILMTCWNSLRATERLPQPKLLWAISKVKIVVLFKNKFKKSYHSSFNNYSNFFFCLINSTNSQLLINYMSLTNQINNFISNWIKNPSACEMLNVAVQIHKATTSLWWDFQFL